MARAAFSTIAEAAINDLIQQHGKAAYATIAERADEALAAAGKSTEALNALTQQFPNSDAARRAGRRCRRGGAHAARLWRDCQRGRR